MEVPRDEQDINIQKSSSTGFESHVYAFDVAPIPVLEKKASNSLHHHLKMTTPRKSPPKRKGFLKPQPTREASKQQYKYDDVDSD